MFSVWMAKNEPRPEYTAWPKLSMPPWPSSMLKARQAMIAIPICDSIVSDRLLVKISGATNRITAYRPQTNQRPMLYGLKR